MRFGILGPLEVTEGHRQVHVGGPKVRTLLAALLVHANEVVSADQLGAILWPSSPPGDLLNALQTLVSRLRAIIDPAAGRSRPAGQHGGRRLAGYGQSYALEVTDDDLDALAFEATSRQARAALARGDAAEASALAERSLAHWRGRALDEFAHEAFAEARATQLEEQRLLTIECRVDADLALGRHRDLVGDLQQLASEHPLREPLWGQLMLALYRSGRQSEALRTYERLRRHLADELGINPSGDLVRLERAVLEQDPSLDRQGLPGPAEPSSAVQRPEPSLPPGAGPAHGTLRPVTFLFTDVEQSTALWDREPTAMAAALRDHDAVLRQAIVGHAGQVFARPGDGFCAVFDRATDAIEAAIEAQGALRPGSGARSGGDPVQLHVRMAIHTGDAEEREGTFFGAAVNRTARMRDAAHGGQVLVSAATRELIRDSPAEGALAEGALIDIGTWLFEGFSRPERVHQLEHPALGTGFPPLRSGRPHTTKLPRHTTSFVGRHHESEATVAALRANRLVTLTGEGGIGKTRLALEVAQRADLADYPDGVWFCDVSTVDDADGIAEALAAALRLATPVGTDVRAQVVAAVQGARMLLLIDNAERLRSAVGELVGEILATSSEAKVLATSRAPLRTSGEHVIQLAPLELPEPGAPDAAEAPAVRLLIDRARAAAAPVKPDDPALVAIARHLDGVPLAIELAAPRLASMPATALAGRLDRRFELLTGSPTVPARQRTLRSTIEWSFNLLDPDAQLLFGALSVFRGGWTLDSAELVTSAAGLDAHAVAPLIADLAEQSMINAEVSGEGIARYRMLETMQAYGAEHLAQTGCRPAVANRHADHFIALAEKAKHYRRGPLEPAWVSEIEIEFDNLRAAYRWVVDTRPRDALRLVAALADDVIMRERLEVGRWAQQLAALPAVAAEPLRAVALGVASNTALIEGRLDDARQLGLAALEIERETAAPPGWIAYNTLALLSAVGAYDGDWQQMLDTMAEMSRTTGDPLAAAVADYERVVILSLFGEPEKGEQAAESVLELGSELSNPSILAMGYVAKGLVVTSPDPDRAGRYLHDGLAFASSAHNTLLAQYALRAIEELNARSGDRPAALASLRTVARRFEQSGNRLELLNTLISMLDSLVAMGQMVPAATICGGLSRTPARLTAAVRLVDRTVAERLDRDRYVTARRRGAAMTPSELVAFATALVQEVTGDDPAG